MINNESYQTPVGFDKEYNYVIPKQGDFIKDIFLKFKLPDLLSGENLEWKQNISQLIIEKLCVTVNNKEVYFTDTIYSGIQNILDGNRSPDEVEFKVNVVNDSTSTLCYVHVPIWNKLYSRQFLPIGSLHQVDVQLKLKIAPRKSLLKEI